MRPYIEDLVARLDSVTDQIVRDPSVADDPDSPLVEELAAIYAPDSAALDGALDAFRRDAAAGYHMEPLDSETTITSNLTGDPQTVDESTVKTPVCSVRTYRKLGSDGGTVEHVPRLAHPGEVFAVRVEGEWRIDRVDVFTNTICTEEPSA